MHNKGSWYANQIPIFAQEEEADNSGDGGFMEVNDNWPMDDILTKLKHAKQTH